MAGDVSYVKSYVTNLMVVRWNWRVNHTLRYEWIACWITIFYKTLLLFPFVYSADDEFGSDSDHEQVTEDAHLSAEHTHDDHHSAEGDDHYHDHNHDGKHDHEDHHLGMSTALLK